jgi:hypothetical protein
MLPPNELNAWLTAAFPDRPGWNIRDHRSGSIFCYNVAVFSI